MSSERFDDLLNQARVDLTPDEQLKFIHELTKLATATNGTNRKKSLYDALSERGIIGSITDAPSDLGTNPRHMEGFGRHDS